jgi:hypothetical protein
MECKKDPLIQIVRTHPYSTTITNSSKLKSFQNEAKEMTNVTPQGIKKTMPGQFPCSIEETLVDRELSYK